MTVMDILFAVNARSFGGLLFDTNGSGTLDDLEVSLRVLANELFTRLNEL